MESLRATLKRELGLDNPRATKQTGEVDVAVCIAYHSRDAVSRFSATSVPSILR
jgi:hypothetical protein